MQVGVVRLPSKGQLVIPVKLRKGLVLLRPQLRSAEYGRAHSRGTAGQANRHTRLFLGVTDRNLSVEPEIRNKRVKNAENAPKTPNLTKYPLKTWFLSFFWGFVGQFTGCRLSWQPQPRHMG